MNCSMQELLFLQTEVMIDNIAERKKPMWKRRLQNKIKELRKDLSQLEA